MMRALAGLVPAITFVCLACAACGGGDGEERLSQEQYFDRVEALFDGAQTTIFERVEGFAETEDEDKAREQGATLYGFVAGTFADLADDLDDLDPPERLDDLHSELADAISNYARSLAAYAEEASPVLTGSGDQLEEICEALERAASEEGVSIELPCSEESDHDQTIGIAPGIRGRLAEMSTPPDGLEAATEYIELEVEDEAGAVVIGLPLLKPRESAEGLAWYAYEDGEWKRLETIVMLENDGQVASGDFESVPASLAALREE